VRESFLKSAAAGRMGVPAVPLTELYGVAADYITTRGGEVRYRCGVDSFVPTASGVQVSAGESLQGFDFVVLAVPFDALSRILPAEQAADGLTSPITGIHLWFDRRITDLDHAVLLDRTIQWMFHKSNLLGRYDGGSYVELVVSASKTLVDKGRTEIIDMALSELREFFPEARTANLVKSTVIKEIHATYSPRPGADLNRPKPQTVWPRVFLAGDWTATGWPATMEGAVRSGYLAGEAVAQAAGVSAKFLRPDLPAAGLMRLFG
jgi:zeta-carotene desaturase